MTIKLVILGGVSVRPFDSLQTSLSVISRHLTVTHFNHMSLSVSTFSVLSLGAAFTPLFRMIGVFVWDHMVCWYDGVVV